MVVYASGKRGPKILLSNLHLCFLGALRNSLLYEDEEWRRTSCNFWMVVVGWRELECKYLLQFSHCPQFQLPATLQPNCMGWGWGRRVEIFSYRCWGETPSTRISLQTQRPSARDIWERGSCRLFMVRSRKIQLQKWTKYMSNTAQVDDE
jgi:hypothetical protein